MSASSSSSATGGGGGGGATSFFFPSPKKPPRRFGGADGAPMRTPRWRRLEAAGVGSVFTSSFTSVFTGVNCGGENAGPDEWEPVPVEEEEPPSSRGSVAY